MVKRGQLMIFVVMSVIVFLALIMFLFVEKKGFDSGSSRRVESVEEGLEECFEDNLRGVVGNYGSGDGIFPGGDKRYYYDKGLVYPSVEKIEGQLEEKSKEYLLSCISFYNESYDGVNIAYEDLGVNYLLLKDSVDVRLDLDVYFLEKENSYLYDFSEKSYVFSSDLLKMHETAVFFAKQFDLDQEAVSLTKMIQRANDEGLKYSYSLEDDEVVVLLRSREGRIPADYLFYNQLSGSYSPPLGVAK